MKGGLSITEAFKVPFKSYARSWYWLWMIIPIIGSFAFLGYMMRVLRHFINGHYDGLPETSGFWNNFASGFFAFLFSITVGFVYIAIFLLPWVGKFLALLWGLITVMMMLQYAEQESFKDGWNVASAVNLITRNFGEYIIAILKTIVVGLLYAVCMIPVVTIPFLYGPAVFGQQVLLCEFYKDHK